MQRKATKEQSVENLWLLRAGFMFVEFLTFAADNAVNERYLYM